MCGFFRSQRHFAKLWEESFENADDKMAHDGTMDRCTIKTNIIFIAWLLEILFKVGITNGASISVRDVQEKALLLVERERCADDALGKARAQNNEVKALVIEVEPVLLLLLLRARLRKLLILLRRWIHLLFVYIFAFLLVGHLGLDIFHQNDLLFI